MASIPGGQYHFFASGQAVNVATTPDGTNLPPPVLGQFNLELVTSASDPPGIPAQHPPRERRVLRVFHHPLGPLATSSCQGGLVGVVVGVVVKERVKTDSRVVFAGGVVQERVVT